MTSVGVYSYTHSTTYVADNILKSLKDIIQYSGLDPSKFVGDWEVNRRGVKIWLETEHLETVVLEIYDPRDDELLYRWDIDIVYGWTGDGSFWVDTDQLRYAIRKAGIAPSSARYDIVLRCKPGRPDVTGWSPCRMRSTDGMLRQSLGTTVEHHGLGGNTAYWRRA